MDNANRQKLSKEIFGKASAVVKELESLRGVIKEDLAGNVPNVRKVLISPIEASGSVDYPTLRISVDVVYEPSNMTVDDLNERDRTVENILSEYGFGRMKIEEYRMYTRWAFTREKRVGDSDVWTLKRQEA